MCQHRRVVKLSSSGLMQSFMNTPDQLGGKRRLPTNKAVRLWLECWLASVKVI